jgi:ArsR family transcriptional regulator
LLGLSALGDVLDIASGDGAMAELVAARARTVCCLDVSEKVIDAARQRLHQLAHLRFVCGDMHALPFDDASFDAVMLMNGLTYAERPRIAIREAARVLRAGGVLTGVTLAAHDQRDAVAAYGHVNDGFAPKRLARLLRDAELVVERCEVTHREPRPPHFEVITFHAHSPQGEPCA